MLTRERNLESTLLEAVREHFEKLSVVVSSVYHDQALGVIDLRVELPHWADRSLRLDVLSTLAAFEREIDHSVVISPTLVWDTDAADD